VETRDEYSEEGEGVVMLEDGRVLSLSPVAWTLLSALASGPMDTRSIADHLADTHGLVAAEDGTDLTVQMTQGVLHELEREGVVHQSS
jgi:hypothetical protein